MSGNRRSDDVEMNSKYNSSTSSASSEDEPPTYKEVVQSKKQSTHRLIKLFIAAMAYYINTLDSQSSGLGRCGPNYFKVGDLF